jgi:eukaryotic translation initiation factor 2C
MSPSEYGQVLDDRFPLLNLGSADRPTYFPAENVTFQEGQIAKVKLMKEETTDMLDFACRSPFANAFSIATDGRKVLGLDDPSLARFGIAVDKKLLTVTGRVLQSPQVAYGGGKKAMVVRASWNMAHVQVVKPGAMIQNWTYVNIASGNRDLVSRSQVEKFSTFLTTMGIKISKSAVPPLTELITDNNDLENFFAWCQKGNIQFVLFLFERYDSAIYNRVKILGDCQFGIATSCVMGSKLAKGQLGYFANVGLKWNLKAGGVNHKLVEELDLAKQSKTMVVGYDVTHPTNMPSGKADNIPSLVGVVATIDAAMGQWPAISWEQKSKQEMLDQRLTDAFKSRLELWQKHNMQKLPENIVIFRDGVSEGQFSQVLDHELPLIRAACAAKYKQSPRLTIVVSVKRHQTRFYPSANPDQLDEGNRNILNGTVVDRGVTQASVWDFYLTAHNAIKGTARPAHYTVLLDEVFRAKYNKEAANQLEKFTHGLCYLYGRATKAVSICPPAYYADIVCTRARSHRPEFDVSDGESMTTAGGASPAREVHPNLRDTMYYI